MVGKAVQHTQKEYTENASKVLYLYDEVDELTGFAEKSDDTDLEYKYEYNESGDRTSLEIKGKIKKEDVSEIIKYEYEEGLLIKETSSRKGDIQYEYDGNGNLVKKTGADNDVSYEYTVENRLKAVKSGGELLMAAGYDGDGNRIFQVTRNARDFKATNPLEEEPSSEQIKAPNTGDNNWYLEAFLYGVWQGTANNLAAFNSSLAVKYTEDLRDEWDDIYHGRVYDKEAGDQRAYDDSRVVVDIAGLGYAAVAPKSVVKSNSNEISKKKTAKTTSDISECNNVVWNMSKGGSIINGREYSQHALERMAPDTISVRAELEKRAMNAAVENGYSIGGNKYNEFIRKYVDPRGIPPMVVENTIRNTKPVQGRMLNTLVHESKDLIVIVNDKGKVITVYPKHM